MGKTSMAGGKRYKPYPQYKDSGVEWLGEIPEHWEVKRLKYNVIVNPALTGIQKLHPDTEVSFIPMEAIGQYGGINLSLMKRIEDVRNGYTYFADDDVIVAKITPCFENGKGALAVGLNNGIAFGTTELHVLRRTHCVSKNYLLFFSFSDAFRKLGEAEMYGAGGQKRVPNAFVENFMLPTPSIFEQEQIASFINVELTKIDALVEKNEKLIELLQEKRTALISHAVTRGLDSKAAMKDSGVEWLGEIPEHWKVKMLRHLTPQHRQIMYGIVLPGPNVDQGVPIIKGGDVSIYGIDPREVCKTSFEIECQHKRSRLEKDDLVYAIRGSVGEVAVVPKELSGANMTQDVARISYMACIFGKWLLYTLKSRAVFAQLDAGIAGAAVKGINIYDLKRTLIPVPPENEQESLAAFLERETAKIDVLIAKVHDAIDRLKERRIALISAAVTGKIDVREEMK